MLETIDSTLKFAYVIDKQGFIINSIVVDTTMREFHENEISNTILPSVYKPKWTGTEWIEGATQEEIDELTKVEPSPPTQDERIKELEMIVNLLLMGGL